MKISITHDLDKLAKTMQRQREDMAKIVVSTLNKTVGNTEVAVRKDVAKATGLAQGKIKPHLSVNKANRTRMEAAITTSKPTFNLIRFATPAAVKNYRKTKGLKAKAWGKAARVFPGVFIGNKGRTAFIREGKKIRGAHGPSIPRAMASKKIAAHAREVIATRWDVNFRSQMKRKFERKR